MNNRRQMAAHRILIIILLLSIVSSVFTWEVRESRTMVENSVTYVLIPLQKGVDYIGTWVSGQIDFIMDINSLEDQNKALREQVNQLEYENNLLQQEKQELTSLRQLYELDERYADYPKTGARVIGKDPGNWYYNFIIDKGSQDGLKVDMVVMARHGLAGRIIEVGPNYAKVMSIIDELSSISAKLLRTADLCTVSGDLTLSKQGMCRVHYIGEEVPLKKGEEIVTSHLGDVYPPGILIGRIKEIEANGATANKTAILEPVVDFQHLEEVLVINKTLEVMSK